VRRCAALNTAAPGIASALVDPVAPRPSHGATLARPVRTCRALLSLVSLHPVLVWGTAAFAARGGAVNQGAHLANENDSHISSANTSWEESPACPFPLGATTEVVERQQFNRLPPSDYKFTMAPDENLKLVMRLRGEMLEASKLAINVPGVPERARLLRKKPNRSWMAVISTGFLPSLPSSLRPSSLPRKWRRRRGRKLNSLELEERLAALELGAGIFYLKPMSYGFSSSRC
jgi:hypothetical protein